MKTHAGRWTRIALFNLLVAGLIGLLLRFAFVVELKWFEYKSFQDAHSNMALLGWIFQASYAGLVSCFIPENDETIRKYSKLFNINQVLVILLTLSFVFSLSRLISNSIMIIFSLMVAYFTITFIKDVKKSEAGNSISFRFAEVALIFLLTAFTALYAITPILFLASAKKVLFYYLGVQFFLHFQYNGWFTFVILALLFRFAEKKNVILDKKKTELFIGLMIAGIVLNYFLTLYWGYRSHLSFLYISTLGTLIQIAGIIYLRKELKKCWNHVSQAATKLARTLLWISAICFGVKLIMQLITIVPDIATLGFTIRNYVIAYLHLVFLGVMTTFTIGWGILTGQLQTSKLTRAGILLLAIGFILMESILFLQGTMLWIGLGFLAIYYELIFLISVFLPAGISLIIFKGRSRISSIKTG